uniref:Putative ovule protein n=1 Tax=Solanum chacoense TaxID=4108 RepID=A0A0V0J0W1_SOLCH
MDIRKIYLDGSIMIRHKICGKLVGIGPRSKFSSLLSWVVAGCSCVSHRLLLISAPGGCPELLEELLLLLTGSCCWLEQLLAWLAVFAGCCCYTGRWLAAPLAGCCC